MRFFALLVLAGAIMTTGNAFGQDAESANLLNGVAIKGYDPVAYFTLGEATPGNEAIALEHAGIVYHFSTEEHRDLFEANPERYIPAYGGWCAWAAARNDLADIDPEAFVIHEDVLYLNFSSFINGRFRLRLGRNIQDADANWPDLAERAAEQ